MTKTDGNKSNHNEKRIERISSERILSDREVLERPEPLEELKQYKQFEQSKMEYNAKKEIIKKELYEIKEKEQIKLNRDTCEKCIALKGKVNSLDRQLCCSQGHAHEEYFIEKSKRIEILKKEIFDVIYQWGRVGVVADEKSPAIKERLQILEETWY